MNSHCWSSQTRVGSQNSQRGIISSPNVQLKSRTGSPTTCRGPQVWPRSRDRLHTTSCWPSKSSHPCWHVAVNNATADLAVADARHHMHVTYKLAALSAQHQHLPNYTAAAAAAAIAAHDARNSERVVTFLTCHENRRRSRQSRWRSRGGTCYHSLHAA